MARAGDVLLCSAEPRRLEEVAPLLQRSGLKVHTRADHTSALEAVQQEAFDLVIFGFASDRSSLADLVEAVRSDSSPSRSAGVLVLADSELRLEAESWVGRGVNRVVSKEGEEGRLLEAIANLLHVAPRIALRTMVRLEMAVVLGRIVTVAQTENISRSGMLVRGGSRCAPGDRVGFDLELPGEHESVRGRLVIVRRTDRRREQLAGIGAAFDTLSPSGRERLEHFLEQRLTAT
jgi:DNA-binding NarL/FixJ family response regulator